MRGRVVFCLLIFLVVFSCLGYYFSFFGVSSGGEDSVVWLHGISFRVPAGYMMVESCNGTDDLGITTEDYIFANDEGYIIDLSILYNGNVENFRVDDSVHWPCSLGGRDGMASSGRNFFNFIFRVGDCQVSVLARNESVVEKFIGVV
ncbi:MAG: hypothetical protein BZ138_00470 [Methanosphaera sp. rholeuAM270]|nr:MAG: hypothetical protein BZ138_00470 [Methanosphaera sp. rholeuAM270]